MWKLTWTTIVVVSTMGPALWCSAAFAQEADDSASGSGETSVDVPSSGGQTTVVVKPAPATVNTQTTVTPFGLPSAGFDPDSGLPSSSRAAGEDRFDLGTANTPSVRGTGEGSLGIRTRAARVPYYHTVRRGDTLWDLCGHYHGNPWAWPRIWSYNPQVENPHWIYPGDRLRMRGGGDLRDPSRHSFIDRRGALPPGTIFLRNRGYIGGERDVWGTVAGSPDEEMMLTENNTAYLAIKEGRDVKIGQEFTIFRPMRRPEVPKKAKGQIVAIEGTARVTKWDPKTRIAEARITESLNVIERGARVGPIGRRFDVVPPVRNDVELWATVLADVEPRELIGEQQVVFINKGSKDGLRAGNRLFAVFKGDRWRQSIKMGEKMAAHRMHYELRRAEILPADKPVRQSRFPSEVMGEIRVLRTEEHTSACVVTDAQFELEPGARVVARRGY